MTVTVTECHLSKGAIVTYTYTVDGTLFEAEERLNSWFFRLRELSARYYISCAVFGE
ncbi:MAG: hypothetical protein U0694_22940 [Anaerolineae bacterium]